MDIRQQLLLAFEAEHREHVDAIRDALSDASGGGPDWNDVFRRAHSLKGASRAVDMPPVEAVSHRLETLFEQVSSGRRPFDRTALDAVHLALDRIEGYVADAKDGAAAMDPDALAALDACLSGEPVAAASSVPSRAAPPEPATPVPAPPPPRETPAPETASGEAAPPDAGSASEAGQAVLRVPAAAVQAVTEAAYGLANVLPDAQTITEGLARFSGEVGRLRRTGAAARGRVGSGDAERVRTDLHDLEGGLAALERLAADLLRAQKTFTLALDGSSRRVHEEAERLALVPASTVFGGFARALREWAREAGREVDVVMTGLDMPVDRGTLQILKDPVLHALRNALSHGGEPPEARLRAGKKAALMVGLTIALDGAHLILRVEDDGRGPDLAAIAERAQARALLGPGETPEAERLLALVFEPGFSTAAALDTLSGRGIGLSVVAEAVRRLQGSVVLRARRPHGTALILSVPLSAARRALLVVEAGGAVYALPSGAVARLVDLGRLERGSVGGRAVAYIREGEGEGEAGRLTAVPIAALDALMGGPVGAPAESGAAILVRGAGQTLLLTVDRLHDVSTRVVLPPPPIGIDPAIVMGTVVAGNAPPLLVLDPDGLVARAAERAGRAAIGTRAPAPAGDGTLPPRPRSTILVVDDSITTRTLEKSILEAAGYRVVVCVDGQDALDHLRSGSDAIDLVLADVEMPRMTGFELVEALRADARFAELPLILMTSRGAAEDVARGLHLGADAYLTKQTFDQRALLETVGQLL